jgi:3-deoxy-7-phosphoheptulonate synthase
MNSINSPTELKVRRRQNQNTRLVAISPQLHAGGDFVVIAGPCALENATQVDATATAVKLAGAHALRGGAFKPRTSPYSFQGLGEAGLTLLAQAGERLGMPIVSEVMSEAQVESMAESVDLMQIGARNMANFALLKAVSKVKRPILLKRGFGSTLDEWLLAAEYIVDGGNDNVILCERGIRSFDNTLRNTLDLAGVAYLKEKTHLPIFVDPSHATGRASLVTPMALAAAAAGADGLLIEVHITPEKALCDADQALSPDAFRVLMQALSPVLHAVGRKLLVYPPLHIASGT